MAAKAADGSCWTGTVLLSILSTIAIFTVLPHKLGHVLSLCENRPHEELRKRVVEGLSAKVVLGEVHWVREEERRDLKQDQHHPLV